MLEELSREELIGFCRQLITQVAELDQLRQANVNLTDRVARLERLVSRSHNGAAPAVVGSRSRRWWRVGCRDTSAPAAGGVVGAGTGLSWRRPGGVSPRRAKRLANIEAPESAPAQHRM
ncbi:hypothetical protein [Dactylosporangium darangshiense]|uniref:Transposase n=1 Tax=Dactylosporangium darangshiense TaxID=579108 RepID=A0ABP8DV62_9ACTN